MTTFKHRQEPRKALTRLRGQHFLNDKKTVAKIIAAAELSSADTVLEVGPGLGVMTREILPLVGKLIAVELDPFFVYELRKDFAEASPRLTIIEGDILKTRTSDLLTKSPNLKTNSYKLVSNLPYNITSAFLKKFLIEPPHPERIVIMLQKEVADRITAVNTKRKELNSKTPGMLGLMCNLYAECFFVCKVPASAFTPSPKVESAVICLKPYSEKAFATKWEIGRGQAEDVLAFASRFFSQPRKKMCGALGKSLTEKCCCALQEIGESPDSRPAVLSLEKWVELWKKLR